MAGMFAWGHMGGFWSNQPVRVALVVGGGAALVCAVVGLSTVMRRQAFAGHALADVSGAGGSASFLLGINPLFGFLGMAAAAAGVMEWAQVREARERDLLTGVVLGAGLGLAALLLYLDMTVRNVSGAAITVLFGSMFTIPPSIVPVALTVAAAALGASALVFRPLLVSTLSVDLARAQGASVRTIALIHALALALAVSLAAMTVGAILSTALLIGPAAAALQVARRPASALALAALIGLAAAWGGIALAYQSYYWTPGHGWPVSFFIVMLIVCAYLVASAVARRRAGSSATAPRLGCQEH
ncbi:MAG: metal ABC transporter permease [Steroidobacteraceae bacterium]